MLDFLFLFIAVALGGGGDGQVAVAAETQAATTATASVAAEASSERVAEDQTPSGKFLTATETKPILNATKGNWIAVREWEGQDLIYVTHLWAWRCGLFDIALGVNGAEPEIWPLPDCHADSAQPNAILEGDGLPYRAFPLKSVETVTVVITYDDLSTDMASFDRNGVLIP